MIRNDSRNGRTDTKLTRRGFVAAAGGALVAGIAGCSDVTERSFAARPVVLPEPAQEDLALAETSRDSETFTREGPTGNVKVSITNHAAVYQRGPVRGMSTVLEQFASGVNQTPGSGSVINALASEAGVDDVALPFLEAAPSVAGDRFSILIPENARGSDTVDPRSMMALVPGPLTGADTVTYTGDEPGAFFPDEVFFPDEIFSPDSTSGFRVFVPNVDPVFVQTPEVGIEDLPEGAERVDPGETVETAETVVAGRLADFENPHQVAPPSEVFDAGVTLPLGGQPYGLGALATPTASVAGQPANPLVQMETTELLQHDAANRVLAGTGITDADEIEWLTGPQEPTEWPIPDEWDATELNGNGTDIAVFVGVVSGEDGPWGVLLAVARATDEDHVVAAGATTRPVGTVDGGMALMESQQFLHRELMAQAGGFTAEAMARLERVER